MKVLNGAFCLMLAVVLPSCIGKHQSDAQKATVNPAVENTFDMESDTLRIAIANSTIDWVATEMRGTIRRTGIISFKEGFFLTDGDRQIVGGIFSVDMETMDVTDVPIHEKIARKNLIDHLKSDDFFNVANYPIATMELTSVQKLENDSLKISGNFTIREITKNIEFLAHQKDGTLRTIFTFNRLDWNIAYEGSWADRTLVDKDVELTIEIVMN